MSSIIYQQLNTLVSYLSTLTGVDGYVGWRDQDRNAKFPSLNVLKRDTTYIGYPPIEVATTSAKALVKVGEIISNVEIRVNSEYASQREELEDTVLRAFMRNPLNRGCLTLTVPSFAIDGYDYGVSLYASFDLGNSTWHDEMVFTRPRFSYLEIKAQTGIFVGVDCSDINELDLCINNDVTSNVIIDETVITDPNHQF